MEYFFIRIHRFISIVILVVFLCSSIKTPSYAQVIQDPIPRMPAVGSMVHLSPEYTPAFLKGIVIHPENAFKFDFIVYKGDKVLTDPQKRLEYTKLIKYFLASLAIPDDDQWVNLSPYEKDRIIKDDFGKTEMGRDLLAQDYMLKQITASLIYPEDNLGKKFWDKVYAQAQEQYGTTDIPVNTFNKVWILPDDALIYEKGNIAYVLKNHLRVMLEEDYLALTKHKMPNAHSIASKIVKAIILPELEREVNEDENFAPLRQVYSGMLLATWYKQALKESLLSKIYANKAKLKGIDQDPKTNEQIYHQYLKAYKKGVFNFIKEDVNKYTNETVPRKYFSGGMEDYAMASEELGHKVLREIKELDHDQNVEVERELGKDDDALMLAAPAGSMGANGAAKDVLAEESDKEDVKSILMKLYFGVPIGLRVLTDFYPLDYKNFKNYMPLLKLKQQLLEHIKELIMQLNYVKTAYSIIYDHDTQGWVETSPAIDEAATELMAMVLKLMIPKGVPRFVEPSELLGDEQVSFMYGDQKYEGTVFSNTELTGLQLKEYPSVFLPWTVIRSLRIIDHAMNTSTDKLRADPAMTILEEVEIGRILKELVKDLGKNVGSDFYYDYFDHFMARKYTLKKDVDLINYISLVFNMLDKTKEHGIGIKKGDSDWEAMTKAQQKLLKLMFKVLRNIVKNGDWLEKDEREKTALWAKKEYEVLLRELDLTKDPSDKDAHMDSQPGFKDGSFEDIEKDRAMKTEYGGIDFNATHLDLQIKRDDKGMVVPMLQQDLENIQLEGLVPVVLDIKPATASPLLSEL